jgi:hypothetical protein
MVKPYLFIHRNYTDYMVEIRIILSETEYEAALKAKRNLHWRDVLLNAIGLEAETRRGKGRPSQAGDDK